MESPAEQQDNNTTCGASDFAVEEAVSGNECLAPRDASVAVSESPNPHSLSVSPSCHSGPDDSEEQERDERGSEDALDSTATQSHCREETASPSVRDVYGLRDHQQPSVFLKSTIAFANPSWSRSAEEITTRTTTTTTTSSARSQSGVTSAVLVSGGGYYKAQPCIPDVLCDVSLEENKHSTVSQLRRSLYTTSSSSGTFQSYDVLSSACLHREPSHRRTGGRHQKPLNEVTAVFAMPTEMLVWCGCRDGTVRVFTTESQASKSETKNEARRPERGIEKPPNADPEFHLLQEQVGVHQAAISCFASASGTGAQPLGAPSGAQRNYSKPEESSSSVQCIFCVSHDGTATQWQASSPFLCLGVVARHEHAVRCAAVVLVRGGGGWLATGADDRPVRLWRIPSIADIQPPSAGIDCWAGREVIAHIALHGHSGSVCSMVYVEERPAQSRSRTSSGQGHFLWTGGADKVVRVWDLDDILERHLPLVVGTPTDRSMRTVERRRSVSAYREQSAETMYSTDAGSSIFDEEDLSYKVLWGHKGSVVSLTQIGRVILSCDQSGFVMLWHVEKMWLLKSFDVTPPLRALSVPSLHSETRTAEISCSPDPCVVGKCPEDRTHCVEPSGAAVCTHSLPTVSTETMSIPAASSAHSRTRDRWEGDALCDQIQRVRPVEGLQGMIVSVQMPHAVFPVLLPLDLSFASLLTTREPSMNRSASLPTADAGTSMTPVVEKSLKGAGGTVADREHQQRRQSTHAGAPRAIIAPVVVPCVEPEGQLHCRPHNFPWNPPQVKETSGADIARSADMVERRLEFMGVSCSPVQPSPGVPASNCNTEMSVEVLTEMCNTAQVIWQEVSKLAAKQYRESLLQSVRDLYDADWRERRQLAQKLTQERSNMEQERVRLAAEKAIIEADRKRLLAQRQSFTAMTETAQKERASSLREAEEQLRHGRESLLRDEQDFMAWRQDEMSQITQEKRTVKEGMEKMTRELEALRYKQQQFLNARNEQETALKKKMEEVDSKEIKLAEERAALLRQSSQWYDEQQQRIRKQQEERLGLTYLRLKHGDWDSAPLIRDGAEGLVHGSAQVQRTTDTAPFGALRTQLDEIAKGEERLQSERVALLAEWDQARASVVADEERLAIAWNELKREKAEVQTAKENLQLEREQLHSDMARVEQLDATLRMKEKRCNQDDAEQAQYIESLRRRLDECQRELEDCKSKRRQEQQRFVSLSQSVASLKQRLLSGNEDGCTANLSQDDVDRDSESYLGSRRSATRPPQPDRMVLQQRDANQHHNSRGTTTKAVLALSQSSSYSRDAAVTRLEQLLMSATPLSPTGSNASRLSTSTDRDSFFSPTPLKY